jgi:hypothetical protein
MGDIVGGPVPNTYIVVERATVYLLFGFNDYYPEGGADDLVDVRWFMMESEARRWAEDLIQRSDFDNHELGRITDDARKYRTVARWRVESDLPVRGFTVPSQVTGSSGWAEQYERPAIIDRDPDHDDESEFLAWVG